MAFPISLSGDLALSPDRSGPTGAGDLLAGLESALRDTGLAATRRTSTSLGFEGGWRAPWPFKGCSGSLEIERDPDDGDHLSYHLSFQAWAMVMTVVVPLLAYLLLSIDPGIAPVLQFGILLATLPIGWIAAMALVHRVIGVRVRRSLEQALLSVDR